jgi:hypothetical protein
MFSDVVLNGKIEDVRSSMADIANQIDGMSASNTQIVNQICGVKWVATQSSPALARLGYAVGKNAGNDFNSIYPYSLMKLCNIGDDGSIRAFLGDPGFARDGSNGEVMWLLAKFYYKHTYDQATKTHEYWVSPVPIDGYILHPAFIRNGVEKPYIFIGAYKAGVDASNKITSRTGIIPKTSATRANFRGYATAKGAKWYIEDVLTRNALGLLIMIEFATLDTQAAIGKGITEMPFTTTHTVTEATTNANAIIVAPATGTNYTIGMIIGIGTTQGGNQVAKEREILSIDTSDPTKTIITVDGAPFSTTIGNMIYSNAQRSGKCDFLNGTTGMASGTNGKTSVSWRGLEDLWGNVWEFIDGINVKNAEKQPYFADSSFADDKFDGAYKASGVILPDANGYVKNMCYSNIADWLLMPSEVGGSSSSYVPDNYYQNWAGLFEKVALAGGAWDDGSTAGFFFWHVYYSSGSAGLDAGARALLIP